MNFKSKFQLGDKVIIFQNTERVPSAGRIGKSGVVFSNMMRDIEILLDGEGKSVRIIEDDLELVKTYSM